MRLEVVDRDSFLRGLGVGIATVAVTLLAVGAFRRARIAPERARDEGRIVIDGVRPLEAAELDARPQEEASGTDRLVSEAVDPGTDERW
jgi:hypothetical protein